MPSDVKFIAEKEDENNNHIHSCYFTVLGITCFILAAALFEYKMDLSVLQQAGQTCRALA